VPKRKRRIMIQAFGAPQLGICEYCNMQFPVALGDVEEQFNAHKCKREGTSQATARTESEATENN